MRYLLILLIHVSIILEVVAQQDPYFSHYMWNKQVYNPAAAGETNDRTCVSAIAHNQWLGFDDQTRMDRETGLYETSDFTPFNVAPKTYNVNLSTQIKSSSRRLGGVGLSMYDDRLGATKLTSIKGQMAYFVNFRNSSRLAFGLELSYTNFGFVNPGFRPRQPNDPKIPTSSVTTSRPEISTGFYFTQPSLRGRYHSLFIGASVQHVNQATFQLVSTDLKGVHQMKPHYYVMSGLSFRSANGLYNWSPMVLLKYNSEAQVDASMIGERNNQFRFGLGYRQGGNSDALIAYLGIRKRQLVYGYSYDLTMSRINSVSAGTHEIGVKWCFGTKLVHYHKTPREM